MPTIDLGAARPALAHPPGLLAGLPRRLTLTLPELQLVAEHADGAPLPFELHDPEVPTATSLGGRLGSTPAARESAAYAAALAALHDPGAALSRRGLLVDGRMDESLLGAVGLLATPAVALDLDVSAGGSRAKAWHRQRAGAVATLATSDGLVFELGWLPSEGWAAELARVAVVPPELVTVPSQVPDHVELPYALLDAAAEAVGSGRADLVSVIVAEHADRCRDADGAPLAELEVLALLGGLTGECRGRLRALLADVSQASSTVIGVVSWVLLGDGWRALRPRTVDGVDCVEAVRVPPAALADELAPVLAEVVR